MKLFLIVTVIFSLIYSQKCDDDDVIYVNDFSQDTCTSMEKSNAGYYYSHVDEIPLCVTYSRTTTYKCDTKPCPLAYTCPAPSDTSYPKCLTDLTSCMIYHAYSKEFWNKQFQAKKFKPRCLNDGTWAPKQCKGDINGRCFCYDKKGNRAFGEIEAINEAKMSCSCSAKRIELEEKLSDRFFISLHCDKIGNFEELQCVGGLCWCAEPATGELTAPMVPESNMKLLPCYSEGLVGSQYLRQCDSELYGIETITILYKKHNIDKPNLRDVRCDGDGAYGNYNITSGRAVCTWRDGTAIESWANDLNAISKADITCNCARDKKASKTTLDCTDGGNYKQAQNYGELHYCVDPDGFAKEDPQTNIRNDVLCADIY